MPDDFSLLASQGNNLCFINDRVLILGREVCVVFYPVKVVFEFQNNIFASLNAIFESFVHIRTIKKNINPNINFWIASISAIILFFIILSISIEMSDEDVEKAQSVNVKDVCLLFKLKEFWFFILYVIGVTCFYNVYDQQFPLYYSSMFSTKELGNQIFGYLNSFQVFLEAAMMFIAPVIVNKISAKKGLIIAGLLMSFRIIGSGLATEPILISCMKLLHAVELPIMLISVFKYLAANFDNRLSSILYLVGYQFVSQVGATVLSPIIGRFYDTVGFSTTYIIMGCIVLVFTLISMVTLAGSKKENLVTTKIINENS